MDTRVVTASATGSAAEAAGQLIAELKRGLAGDEPALVMVFASTEQPLGEVAAALTEAFAGSQVLGASTAGEFTERGDTKGAVCAIAVAVAVAGALKVYAGIGLGVHANPERATTRRCSRRSCRVVRAPRAMRSSSRRSFRRRRSASGSVTATLRSRIRCVSLVRTATSSNRSKAAPRGTCGRRRRARGACDGRRARRRTRRRLRDIRRDRTRRRRHERLPQHHQCRSRVSSLSNER